MLDRAKEALFSSWGRGGAEKKSRLGYSVASSFQLSGRLRARRTTSSSFRGKIGGGSSVRYRGRTPRDWICFATASRVMTGRHTRARAGARGAE